MLGWGITIFRQQSGGDSPAAWRAEHGALLATWQAGWGGLDWIDDLIKRRLATKIGGDGYPTQYTAQVEHLRALVLEGPPEANSFWAIGEGDVFVGKPPAGGPTRIEEEALRACDAAEWVLIEAWDQS